MLNSAAMASFALVNESKSATDVCVVFYFLAVRNLNRVTSKRADILTCTRREDAIVLCACVEGGSFESFRNVVGAPNLDPSQMHADLRN